MSISDKIASTFSVDIASVDGMYLVEDAERADRLRSSVGVSAESAPQLLAVTATLDDGRVVEYYAYDGTAKPSEQVAAAQSLLTGRCDITYEDLSPSQCVEYAFADEEPNPKWRLSRISKDGYDHFLACKFKVWEKAIREPDCEAAFRRLLKRGLVYQMFDPNMFPTPPQLVEKYHVKDETNGKIVQLPHPVARCRLWNAASKSYEEVSTQLSGAPTSEDDAKKYWDKFLAELKEAKGADYIESMLKD